MTVRARLYPILAALAAATVACSKSPAALEAECEKGTAASCVAAGDAYLAGQGVARDGDKASMLFERACEGRDTAGCDKARQLYEQGCAKNVGGACSLLGRMYLEGFGVAEDQPKALGLYKKACDLGQAVDCSNLAMMYADGKGVAADPVMAASLYKKACDAGFKDACAKAR